MAVRSALLEVRGVTRVTVSLETRDAMVIYDPRVTKPESLVAAVDAATGPQSEGQFRAEVKAGPRAASAP